MYYNGNNTLTHNALFNFIVGNRGGGKTYWSKDWSIKDFLKNGKQFIYVRRYDTEFDRGKKEKFFDDIKDKYPEHEFKVKGYTAFIDDKPAGQFMALSKSKIEKSTAFPNVNKIIFDEFILDKGLYHYLSDEVVNFLELYETVARLRDDVRVFFLSNALTVSNPYFLYWKLNIKPNKKIQKFQNGLILVEMVANKEFIEKKKKTRFGQLVSGTTYGEYAIENTFLRDNDTFVEKKTGKAQHYFIIKYKGNKYGIWVDYEVGCYYVSEDIDKSCKLIYTLTQDDHTVNTMLLKGHGSRILKTFMENYKMGNVRFESINIKNIFYEIARLYLL